MKKRKIVWKVIWTKKTGYVVIINKLEQLYDHEGRLLCA